MQVDSQSLYFSHKFYRKLNYFIIIYSDKIALWNVVGLQSALLSEYISPIYLSSITVGDMFSQGSLIRALYGRIGNLNGTMYKI
jgi:hypothetical protein